MSEQESNQPEESAERDQRGAWGYLVRGMWRSPLGIFGVILTTMSATLMVLGLVIEMFHLTENMYIPIIAFMVLPGAMVTGLLIIPFAAYLRRRQYYKYGISKDHLQVNLSDHRHRRMLIWFISLTVIFFALLGVIGYEAYHFSDSTFFCGKVCHVVMEPEFEVYQRSAHAKIVCVECHIGPGAQWFVRAKISGMRQVWGVLTNNFNRPIPAPVEHLRPARDTCETCHWPEKFAGKKIKIFNHFSNDNQTEPEVNEIALHIGGHNPVTQAFEGIHWHVSKDVEIKYLASDSRRLNIPKVKVKRPDGSEDEFISSSYEENANTEAVEGEDGVAHAAEEEGGEHGAGGWRVMDCIDCHNRPTHIYDMPEEKVDFGLLSKNINGEIEGIREDSLIVLTEKYPSRDDAKAKMTTSLIKLQTDRHGAEFVKAHEADYRKAGAYLVESYLGNVWPKMNIEWGTYGAHLGHQRADEGWGCFRCHDEEHENSAGEFISQDCSLCHDEPE